MTIHDEIKILLVDDNPDNVFLLSEVLSANGYKIEIALSGRQAINFATNSPPGLILLDIVMPDIDGYEVCRQLKAREITEDIPIIFLSVLNDIPEKQRAFQVGAVDYITKPLQIQEVLIRIENHLKIQRLQKQFKTQNIQLQNEIRERQKVAEALQIRERYLAALVKVERVLLTFDGTSECYTKILEILGAVANASRVYVFENHCDTSGFWFMSQKAEWCAVGIQPEIDNPSLQNLAYDDFFPRWLDILSQGETISGILAEFPESEREILEPQGILSLLVFPIIVKGKFLSFIGFDNCVEARVWDESEVSLLQAAAGAISLAYERLHVEIKLQEQLNRSYLLKEISDKIRANLDTETTLKTAAKQIGVALGVSRTLIHLYIASPSERIPIVGEFIVSGYSSLINVEVPVEGNIHVRQVLSQDKAIVSHDVYVEPLLEDARDICQHLEIKSMVSVRTSYKGEPNGMICLHQCDKQCRWTQEDVQLLESIAAQLGIAIAQAKTLEQEKQARQELDRKNILLQEEVLERIATEIALRNSESKYRYLVETSHDIIWSTDISGCVTFINSSVKYHLGYVPEEVIGRYFTDFILRENLERDIAIFERIVSGEPVFDNESIYLAKDGSLVYLIFNSMPVLDDSGQVIGATGTIHNITRRKQAEQALQASTQKLASAFRLSPDPIAISNFTDGNYIEVNDKFCSFFGYERSEIIGSNSITLNISSYEDAIEIYRFLQDYGRVCNYESEIRTAFGEQKTVLISAEMIDIDGEQYVLSTATDITERKQRENEITLLLSTTQAISRALDFDNALLLMLRLICTNIGWDFAEAWLPNKDDTVLEYNSGWYGQQEDLGLFYRQSEVLAFLKGEGFLGRIWLSKQAEWIEDISQVNEDIFIRRPIAREVGLRSCFGVPILAGDRVLAVLVFFKRHLTFEDERLLNLVSAVAAQLGTLIQRKQAEAAHRKSEERLQLALEATNLGLWDWNLKQRKIFRDIRYKRMLGYEENDISEDESSFNLLVHPDDRTAVAKVLDAYLRGEIEIFEAEFRMRCQSGEWKWIQSRGQIFEWDECGTPVRITGTQKDITERKNLERELAIKEARLNAFFSCAPVGLAIFDEQLRYVIVNEQLAEINGYSVEEHTGKSLEEIPSNMAQLILPIIEQVLSTGQPVLNQELSGFSVQQPHDLRHVLVSYFPIPGEDGRPCGVGAVLVEISDRKRAEAALREREEEFRAMFENAAVGIAKVAPEGRFLKVNPGLCTLLGYTESELLMQDFQSCTYPEDLQRELSCDTSYQEPYISCFSLEKRFIRSDGEVVWTNVTIALVNDITGESKYAIGVVADITPRKLAELALRESQTRFQTLAEVSPVAIVRTDNTGSSLYFNNYWRQITGLSIEESLDYGWVNALHPDDKNYVMTTWRQTVLNRQFCRTEHRFIHKDGTIVWVIAQAAPEIGNDGEFKGHIVTITDITELKEAENALRESADRERAISQVIQRIRQTLDLETIFKATTQELRQVINCDRVVVYRFNNDWSGEFVAEAVGAGWTSLIEEHKNNPDLTIDSLEDERCVVKLMEASSNEVVDTYLQETEGGVYSRGASFLCVPDIYQAGFTQCYLELLERFQAKAYITVPIFRGKELWGLLACYQNTSPRQWKREEINIVVQIGSQLGVALQQTDLLAQTQRQSQALQKVVIAADAANRAKSEFLANMSHELRTPLNAILGFTQVMSRDNSLSAEHQENLTIINRAGEHLLNLINDILEMSKIEAGRTTLNISSFDFAYLLNSLQEMLKFRAASKGLQLIFEPAENVPQYIQSDESKLRQVLLNLLGNAVKFTQQGSVILRVMMGREEELFPHPHTSHSLFFEVIDTGPGIAQSEIDVLFEAFGQTETGRKSQQGTGLGLAISRKYVQLMGGNITVASTLGVGSKFSFNIQINPATSSEIQTTFIKRRVIGLAPLQPEYRILVVDDAIDSRLLLVKLLTSIGFATREAANGAEAIAIWHEWRPNLILMDMRMPIMDGYEATREIKTREIIQIEETNQQLPTTIIIALTANAFEEQRQEILEAGCDDLINKPFRDELLLQKLNQYLGVEYIYLEEDNNQTDLSAKNTEVITNADLQAMISQMPSDWTAQVYQAAAAGSDDLILQLLEQIPPENAGMINHLTDLANNFQFEIIMELMGNGE